MKEKLPLVSVFVLLGNNPEHNQTVLDSINAQTYPNLEIIRNTLDLRSARGDYILVATCDDVYEPSAISDLVKVFSEDGFDMVFFKTFIYFIIFWNTKKNFFFTKRMFS